MDLDIIYQTRKRHFGRKFLPFLLCARNVKYNVSNACAQSIRDFPHGHHLLTLVSPNSGTASESGPVR